MSFPFCQNKILDHHHEVSKHQKMYYEKNTAASWRFPYQNCQYISRGISTHKVFPLC